MERTAENYPYRDHKGLKPMSLKAWLAVKPLGLAAGKPMERGEGPKAKPYVKPAGQAEYEKTHTACEVFAVLTALAPPEWVKFYQGNKAAKELWDRHETHHCYRRQYGHDGWNLIRCYAGCHRFFHGHPRIGRLVAVLAKDAAGQLELEAAKKRLGGKNPLGLIACDLSDGVFSGPCRDAAADLCRKYGLL